MKYLKLYENLTNYKVEVLTSEEFNKLYFKIYPRQTNLKDKIHYFDWHFDSCLGDKKHRDSIRLITAYNKKDILGICFIAWWSSGDHYAVSYLSTNKDYFQMGISKRILDVLFKYFSETYPDDIMYWSGYSIDGWKYLHPKILELSKKYNVKTKEKAIEYPTKWDKDTGEFVTKWDDESHELFDKSREEIEKIYGSYESYIKRFKYFVNEQNKNERDLILKPGSILFHSSGEDFKLPLRVSPYDGILWTTNISIISQTYIPVSGSFVYTTTDLTKRPDKDEYHQKMQKQLGIIYDYDDIRWNNNRAESYKLPDIFVKINNEYQLAWKEYWKVKQEYDNFKKPDHDYWKLPEKEKDEYDEKELEILDRLEKTDLELRKINVKKTENQMINQKIMEFGYKPVGKDYDDNFDWKLKVDSNGMLLPNSYRLKGKLFIIKPKRELKIFDYAKDREGDLNEPDYHKLNLFKKAEEGGYDGIKINDFAQIEGHGNVGHTSIGLFRNTIKDLDVEVLDNVEHPTQDEISNCFDNGNWKSKEYKQYTSK